MSEAIKLSYSSALLRVKVELTRTICLEHEAPAADVIKRAKAKMESVKERGECAVYVIYETRFSEVWKALRENAELVPDAKVIITVAAGTPQLPGIKLEKAPNDKAVAVLSIDAKAEVAKLIKSWQFEWFELFIGKKLRDQGIKDPINGAQLLACFHRLKAGERIQNILLGHMPKLPANSGPKSFSILANKARREIAVLIRDLKDLQQKDGRDQMLTLINHSVRQLSTDGVSYRILKADFLATLQNAMSGPEILGLDLPLVILAALGHQPGAEQAIQQPAMAPYPGMGKLAINVSQDRMEATVGEFNMALYDDASFAISIDWIELEVKRNGLKVGVNDAIKKTLSEAIAQRESLAGKQVAAGIIGSGGTGPTLHKSYKDADTRTGVDLDADNLDIREMQQRATVKANQLIAEIRYKNAPVMGQNVLGEEIPSAPNEELIFRIGEGVTQRGTKFYATMDGLPTIEKDQIYLSKILVHNGDVNLRTGNIRFDGPVEIRGSIDSGAIVETTGDLLVHGTIRGAFVKAGGNIAVRAGIITGATGRVQARGDVTAEFVENSTLICGGNLTVVKVIISSQVICGGTIGTRSKKSGVVAGGRLSCRDKLVTQNLGFKNGAVTQLDVGVDWRIAQAVDIRQVRLEKVQKKLGEDRQVLRELVQRTKAQMTARHQELKDQMQDRLTRGRVIVEKLEKRIAEARSQLTYNPEAKVIVEDILSANVHLTVAGQVVAVANEVAGVAVLSKRRRGSFIVPIEELEIDPSSQAKAS